jgi:hypothetical protein
MQNLSNETVQELTNQLDNLNFNLEELNRALNRTDDFTNWSYAEIFGSIANSLIKMNALEKAKLGQTQPEKKMSRREFLGL